MIENHNPLSPETAQRLSEVVEYPPHRDMLYQSLGNLAHQMVELEPAMDTEPMREALSRHHTTIVERQSEMTAQFFQRSSHELGVTATEDEIWENVFANQLMALQYVDDPGRREEMAVNILVGVGLSSYGMEQQAAQELVQDRMWRIALKGRGMDVMKQADDNIGLCVISGDAEKPYTSIAEHTEEYRGLFMATDEALLPTVNVPIFELEAATPQQQAGLVELYAREENFDAIKTNLDFIADKKQMAKAMIVANGYRKEWFDGSELTGLLTPVEVVDFAAESDAYVDIESLLETCSVEEEKSLFYHLANTDLSLLSKGLNKIAADFSRLGIEELEFLESSGIIKDRRGYIDLSAFQNLPTGTIAHLRSVGVREDYLAESLKSFTFDDQKEFFEQILSGGPFANGSSEIFRDPSKITFLSKEQLLDEARKHDRMHVIASNLDKWTDGGDFALIEELLASPFVRPEDIASRAADLPSLDVDRLLAIFTENFNQSLTDSEEDPYASIEYEPLLHMAEFLDVEMQEKVLAIAVTDKSAIYKLAYKLGSFDKLQPDTVLDALIENELFTIIFEDVTRFSDEGLAHILRRVENNPTALSEMAQDLHKIHTVEPQWLLERLISHDLIEEVGHIASQALQSGIDAEYLFSIINGNGAALNWAAYSLNFNEAVGSERMFQALRRNGVSLSDIALHLNHLKDESLAQILLDDVISVRDESAVKTLLRDSSPSAKENIFVSCVRVGWEAPFINWHNDPLFDDSPMEIGIVEDLEQYEAHGLFLAYPKLRGDKDRTSLFNGLVDRGDVALLNKLVDHVHILDVDPGNVPMSVALALLKSGHTDTVQRHHREFVRDELTEEFFEAYAESGGGILEDIYEYSGLQIDWIDKGIKYFGRDSAPILYLAIKQLSDKTEQQVPAYFDELGITKRGQAGIEQLRALDSQLRSLLVDSTVSNEQLRESMTLIMDNPLASGVVKNIVRFSGSEWGKKDDAEWRRIFTDHIEASDRIRSLSENFTVSKEFIVRTIDAEEFDPSKIDEDARSKYTSIRESVDQALHLAESGGFETIFSEARNLLDIEHERLQIIKEKLAAQEGKEKAVANIESQIQKLNDVRQLGAKEFLKITKENYVAISGLKVKGLDELVRTGIYMRAIRKSPQARQIAESLHEEEATIENIATVHNFIEHIVNNEVFGQYFSTDEARKAFLKTSDTGALRNQLRKVQEGKTSGETTLQFVPTRGMLLELSGHVGDACWASKYGSIAEEFPNISAITFLRNPGKTSERLVGASLVIETKDEDTGEDILILRGMNPIENYINGVKVEDFYSALTQYAQQIAGGRKVAIVLDEDSGQAATNRPVFYDHLSTVKQQLDSEPIRVPEDTTFNGYILSKEAGHPVYYLPT